MTSRILLGKFPVGDTSPNGYGLRISKYGYDVNTANPDNEKLIFNSDWPTLLPLHIKGTTSVNNTTVSVPFNNLGYIPFIAALVDVGRGIQLYQTAQDYLNRNIQVTPSGTTVDASPVYQFTNTGNVYNNAEIKVFGNAISFRSNVNATFYWFVYRRRAF
jgi:hypothetical protein